jgi:hypothetical protein
MKRFENRGRLKRVFDGFPVVASVNAKPQEAQNVGEKVN